MVYAVGTTDSYFSKHRPTLHRQILLIKSALLT